MNKSDLQLEEIVSVELVADGHVYDIEVEDVHCFIATNPQSGTSSISHNSACISLFDYDDEDMMNAKVGNWMVENPHRARANNSAVLIRDRVTEEQFRVIFDKTKEFGEPGFVFADHKDFLVNPCCEIGLYARDDKTNKSGWGLCNLSEINMKKCKEEADFYDACKGAAILGTLQAGYTTFPYLGETTEKIVQREALLGVSMTGMMENPNIALNPKIQKQGARIIKAVNEKIAKMLQINPAARLVCNKPSGTSSCLLGTSSGIHPHHSRRYFRNVQANPTEEPAQYFKRQNPEAVEDSVWRKGDWIITFLCEVEPGSKLKNSIFAIEMLEAVKLTYQNWVKTGTVVERCVHPWLHHNISNTIVVKNEEWCDVFKYIWKNKEFFTGISLLPWSGDKDFPQAPFISVPYASDIIKEYGDEAMQAYTLVDQAIEVFGDVWCACNTVLNNGVASDAMKEYVSKVENFANLYYEGNTRKVTYLLKDLYNLSRWNQLSKKYKEVDWDNFTEDTDNIDHSVETACHGGACSISHRI